MAKRSYQPKCRATRYNTTRISASQSAVLRAETLREPPLPLGCPSTALGGAGAVPDPRHALPERGRSSPRVGVGGAPASWIMSQGAPGHRSLNPCRTGTRLPSAAISRLPRRCRTHTPCPTHRLAKSPSHSTRAPCRTRADKSSNGGSPRGLKQGLCRKANAILAGSSLPSNLAGACRISASCICTGSCNTRCNGMERYNQPLCAHGRLLTRTPHTTQDGRQ